MGLDIIAYRRLHEVPASQVELDEDGFPVDYERYVHFGSLTTMYEEYWPGRSAPYDANPEAYYEIEDREHDVTDMRAGSYSGYNEWRGILFSISEEIAYKLEETHVFGELINFSDCEGVIGSVVADKLYHDFVEYRDFAFEYAQEHLQGDALDWFTAKYDEWTEMFEYAREDGAVWFC